MARTAVAVTAMTEAGVIPTAVDVAAQTTDGNSFPWGPHRFVFIANGDDAAIVPTFINPSVVGPSNLAVADLPGTSIPPAGYAVYGPFDPSFRQADGSVWFDYAGTTPANVTVAVFDAA